MKNTSILATTVLAVFFLSFAPFADHIHKVSTSLRKHIYY